MVLGFSASALGQQGGPSQAAKARPPESSAVPPDEWGQLPHRDWAHILLAGEINLTGGRQLVPPTGFLMRAPTGQVLAVSMWVRNAANVDLADPKGAIQSWTMHPIGDARDRITVGPSVVPADVCQSVQGMMSRVTGALPPGRVEVLTPASGPPPIRKLGYLLVAGDGRSAKGPEGAPTVYVAQIVGPDAHNRPGVFCFGFFSKVDPASMHGGVVLDGEGNVLGIQTGYYPESSHGSVVVGSAADIHALLDAAKLPVEADPGAARSSDVATASAGKVPPATAPTATPAPRPHAAAPTDDPASKALRLARMYESSEQYAPARAKLQQIIERYPNTLAAKQAQADLTQIQGK